MCGDGVMDAGEERDDGNTDDTDTCPGTCMAASCGDGQILVGIEECDDANAEDTAACGDMIVQAGVETCDDGNLDDTDECCHDRVAEHAKRGVC